jgi:hypothetical protein
MNSKTPDDEPQGFYYERVPVKGLPPRGSFRLPDHVINALGGGDPKAGGAVVHGMFGISPFPADDPTIIQPDVVRDIGHCSLAVGHRVLRKLVAMLRARKRETGERSMSGIIWQPDGNHGRRT